MTIVCVEKCETGNLFSLCIFTRLEIDQGGKSNTHTHTSLLWKPDKTVCFSPPFSHSIFSLALDAWDGFKRLSTLNYHKLKINSYWTKMPSPMVWSESKKFMHFKRVCKVDVIMDKVKWPQVLHIYFGVCTEIWTVITAVITALSSSLPIWVQGSI